MKSIIFFLLFPVLAWSQTYTIETVEFNDTYYTVKGKWVIDKDKTTALVTVGNATTVYTLIERKARPEEEGYVWVATSGGETYLIIMEDMEGETTKGMTMLVVSPSGGGIRKIYAGRKVVSTKK